MNQSPSNFNILCDGVGVFESPRWDGENGLFFSNVTGGGIHRFDLRDRRVTTVVPHRRGIGGFALTAEGDFVVSGRNVALKRNASDGTDVLLAPEGLGAPIIGFNDLGVDSRGNVAVGALGPGALSPKTLTGREPAPEVGAGTGAVYWHNGSGWIRAAADIGHPNGIAFSAGDRYAYVSDSLRRVVYRFEVDVTGWRNRIELCRLERGLPDGLAIASDDSIWVAAALAGELLVLESDGAVRSRFTMPQTLTTSVSFGGVDMRTVFVTSGSHDGADPAMVAAFRSPVPGRQLARARVAGSTH